MIIGAPGARSCIKRYRRRFIATEAMVRGFRQGYEGRLSFQHMESRNHAHRRVQAQHNHPKQHWAEQHVQSQHCCREGGAHTLRRFRKETMPQSPCRAHPRRHLALAKNCSHSTMMYTCCLHATGCQRFCADPKLHSLRLSWLHACKAFFVNAQAASKHQATHEPLVHVAIESHRAYSPKAASGSAFWGVTSFFHGAILQYIYIYNIYIIHIYIPIQRGMMYKPTPQPTPARNSFPAVKAIRRSNLCDCQNFEPYAGFDDGQHSLGYEGSLTVTNETCCYRTCLAFSSNHRRRPWHSTGDP